MQTFIVKCDLCKKVASEEAMDGTEGWYQFVYGKRFTIDTDPDCCELPLTEEQREFCPDCVSKIFNSLSVLAPRGEKS